MAKRLVGIDLGTYSVKAVILDGEDLSTLRWDEERILPGDSGRVDEVALDDATTQVREAPGSENEDAPEEAGEALDLDAPRWYKALARMAERNGLSDDIVATFLPGNSAMSLRVPVPFNDANKVRSILPNILADRLPMNMSEVVFDFRVAGEEAPMANIAFARIRDVASHLETLSTLGLDPARVCLPEALLPLAGAQSHGGVTAVLDLGHTCTRLAVYDDTSLIMARTIMTGGSAITTRLAEVFNAPEEKAETYKHRSATILSAGAAADPNLEALSKAITDSLEPVVRDVRRSLQGLYAKERIEVDNIQLCGGTSQIENLDTYFSNRLGLPVERLSLPSTSGAAPSALAYALGKSFRDDIKANVLSLRKGPLAYRGKSSYMRRQFVLLGAAAAVLVVVLVAGLFLQKQALEARRDAMRATLQKQTEKVFGEKLTSGKEIQRRLAGEDGEVKSFVPAMSAYELMYEVTSKISRDQDLDLSRFEVDVDRRIIQIMGETTDAQAVDKLVSDLEAIECLKSIKKDKLKVGSDGRADFELQIATECS